MTRYDQALFDAISHRYVRKDLAPASRIARAHRLRQTLQLAGLDGTQLRILELGCGAGFSADYLKGRYARFVGVDYSSRLIEQARQHHAAADVEFICADLGELSIEPRFDLVLMIGVLHHLPEPAAALRRVAGLLRPGGAVVVNEPQSANLLVNAMRRLRKRMDAGYSREQVEFSAAQLGSIFESAGLQQVRMRAQGVLSTPLAEVVFRPAAVFAPLARLCCAIDGWLERHAQPLLGPVSWNLIVAASAPVVEHEAAVDEQLDDEEERQGRGIQQERVPRGQ